MLHHLSLQTEHAGIELTDMSMAKYVTVWQQLPTPTFVTHRFDSSRLRNIVSLFDHFQNIIVIANGGSRTSALAYYHALAHRRNEKHFEFLSTMEPDVIAMLRSRYTKDNTLIMPISKSGTNVDVLEPLFQFPEYPTLVVTSSHDGVLAKIAVQNQWKIVNHPEIGGRYSGRSACAFAPAILMGLDIDAINNAAVSAYTSLSPSAPIEHNLALVAAWICWHNETKGFNEIFMPIYSQPLTGFLPLIIQLIHESTGKNGKGQTIFGDQAPESQHHTNQRFFGGTRNVMGWFMRVAKQQHHDMRTNVSQTLHEIPFGDATLGDLDGLLLEEALRFDYEGVAENATRLNIPHLTLVVDALTEEAIGELMSFWHYYAVYSALLRSQNPFDQPEVEYSKHVSMQKRKDAPRDAAPIL